MNKIVKVIEFKEQYSGVYRHDNYQSLEDWQKENPDVKILDTRITQKTYTSYENVLLVTYEVEDKEDTHHE